MKKTVYLIIVSILMILSSISLNAQTFTNFTTSNSGLPDDFVVGGVAIDNNNHKWFGTAAGVAEYDDVTWNVYDTADGVIDMYILCIAVDKNNNVWVGTNNGVSKYNGTSWTSFTTADGLIDNAVYYIAGDINGDVWFATYSGASKYNGTNFTNYTTADGLASDVLSFVTVDTLGNKWFGTLLGGVSKYNNNTFTTIDTNNSLVDNSVFAIAIDKDYHKWIGTWYGMSEFNNANAWVDDYDTTNGMYNNYIRDIDVDSRGYVWLGHFADYNQEGGVSVYTGTFWETYSMPEGLVDKQVIRLAIDDNDDIWVATGLGVSKISGFTGIEDAAGTSSASFFIFPNPANSHVDIMINNKTNEVLCITNLLGETVYSRKVSAGNLSISTSAWPEGCYIVIYKGSMKKMMVSH